MIPIASNTISTITSDTTFLYVSQLSFDRFQSRKKNILCDNVSQVCTYSRTQVSWYALLGHLLPSQYNREEWNIVYGTQHNDRNVFFPRNNGLVTQDNPQTMLRKCFIIFYWRSSSSRWQIECHNLIIKGQMIAKCRNEQVGRKWLMWIGLTDPLRR